MNKTIYYNGSVINQKHKEKRGFFFIEELFTGDFVNKAPTSLRRKLGDDDLENIEMAIKSYFEAPTSSKIVFKSYTHFRRTLEQVGINLKRYI